MDCVVNLKMPISEVEQMNYAQYMLANRGRSFLAKLEEQQRSEAEQEPTEIASSAEDLDDLFDGPSRRRRKTSTANGGT